MNALDLPGTAMGCTCEEFFEVYRGFVPEATVETYRQMWERFQREKANHERVRASIRLVKS